MVDVNVGRVAKWLRVMGYDTLFIPDMDDGDLLRIAGEEERVVVTKDRYITERRVVTSGQVRVLLVTSDDFREQMQQLTDALGLEPQNVFTLCIECNESLSPVDKQTVKDRVPPFVHSAHEQFYECPACRKIYWRGTHWRNMRQELMGFAKEAG